MSDTHTLADRPFPHAPPAPGAPYRATMTGGRQHIERRDAALRRFLSAYPAYESTRALDALREAEYARLDQQGQVYLAYTGGSLYAESQLHEHIALLRASTQRSSPRTPQAPCGSLARRTPSRRVRPTC